MKKIFLTSIMFLSLFFSCDILEEAPKTVLPPDGYYNTKEGGIAFAGYQYEGNVTSNQSSVMGAYGKIRYEYVYSQYTGAEMTLHTWTDDVWCSSSLTIVP